MLRIVGEVCPRLVFAENVDEGAILMAQDDLARAGFKTMRGMVAAADLGADHPRERWWLVADADHKGKLGRRLNAEMAFQPKGKTRLWETDPGITGVHDGMAHRVDRFRVVGNGQVPAVAAFAFAMLYRRLSEAV